MRGGVHIKAQVKIIQKEEEEEEEGKKKKQGVKERHASMMKH